MPEIKPSLRWYQKGWAVALIGFGGLVLVLAFAFFFLTLNYWRQIRSGNGPALLQTIYRDFTPSPSSTAGSGLAAVDRTELESADSPFLGNPKAPIVIVEFLDFKCPNCKEASPILQRLLDKYAYKVKLIARHFPAESLHPGTAKLSHIAQCAQEQGRYWQMHDLLFSNQDEIGEEIGLEQLQTLAAQAGVDYGALDKCLSSQKTQTKVNKDYATGYKYGVAGTPTFFVNGEKVEGAVPYDVWEDFVKNY